MKKRRAKQLHFVPARRKRFRLSAWNSPDLLHAIMRSLEAKKWHKRFLLNRGGYSFGVDPAVQGADHAFIGLHTSPEGITRFLQPKRGFSVDFIVVDDLLDQAPDPAAHERFLRFATAKIYGISPHLLDKELLPQRERGPAGGYSVPVAADGALPISDSGTPARTDLALGETN